MVKISTERFVTVAPRLIWATERVWSPEEAGAYSGCYDSRENMVWFVRSGRIVVDGKIVEAGQWMFMGIGRMERKFEGPVRFLSIGLRWLWPDGKPLYEIPEPMPVNGRDLPDLLPMMERVVEDCKSMVGEDAYWLGRFHTDLKTHARLHEIAGRWAAGYTTAMDVLDVVPFLGEVSDPRLETVRSVISGWPLDLPFDSGVLVSRCGISSRHLLRLFQQETGMSPRDAFELRRYEHVRDELLQPVVRIKEVAASVGFTDPAAFNRWFTRRSGRSPRAFRAMFAG